MTATVEKRINQEAFSALFTSLVQSKTPKNGLLSAFSVMTAVQTHCIQSCHLIDPACGSGGMFIQSAELVKSKQGNLNSINIYGQEKEAATYRLAKMNLALRGISHNLGGTNDSSFTHDLHKGLYFNYIMANPPFNL